jgi:hypothetical protein
MDEKKEVSLAVNISSAEIKAAIDAAAKQVLEAKRQESLPADIAKATAAMERVIAAAKGEMMRAIESDEMFTPRYGEIKQSGHVLNGARERNLARVREACSGDIYPIAECYSNCGYDGGSWEVYAVALSNGHIDINGTNDIVDQNGYHRNRIFGSGCVYRLPDDYIDAVKLIFRFSVGIWDEWILTNPNMPVLPFGLTGCGSNKRPFLTSDVWIEMEKCIVKLVNKYWCRHLIGPAALAIKRRNEELEAEEETFDSDRAAIEEHKAALIGEWEVLELKKKTFETISGKAAIAADRAALDRDRAAFEQMKAEFETSASIVKFRADRRQLAIDRARLDLDLAEAESAE